MIKPTIEIEAVRALLADFFAEGIAELAPIAEGQVSRTFSFISDGRGYIVRFAEPNVAGFRREQLTFTRFTPQQPRLHQKVAPPIHLGQFEGYEFAVTRRLPGKSLTQHTPEEYELVLPSLIETHSLIHKIDVSSTTGYGHTDNEGQGQFASWREFIASIRDEEAEDTFHGKWHRLFDESFLERDVFEKYYAEMLPLLEFCPEERWLIQGSGDFGFGNVLAQAGEVTAVLDWSIKYGDFLFDLFGLQLWDTAHDYVALVADFYARQGEEVPHLKERMRCYMLYGGLDACRFFAKTGQQPAYEYTKQRLRGTEI